MADVICPQCGGRYHETTDDFVVGVTTTGNMLKLKDTYKLNGWTSFPEHDGMSFGALECPGCGGMYSDDGKIRIDMAQWDSENDQEPGKRKHGRPKKI